ncbi:MAG: hypothetical protein AB9921_06050 [Erysipelotrichaceae bacterium]
MENRKESSTKHNTNQSDSDINRVEVITHVRDLKEADLSIEHFKDKNVHLTIHIHWSERYK